MAEIPMPPDYLIRKCAQAFLDSRTSGPERAALRPLWEWGYQQGIANAEAQAQAAANAELEACCEWLDARPHMPGIYASASELRAARRPKPPSLKQQSLALIDKIQGNKEMWQTSDLDVVRRALEALPEDESC